MEPPGENLFDDRLLAEDEEDLSDEEDAVRSAACEVLFSVLIVL